MKTTDFSSYLITNILFFIDENEHYGLKVLFELDDKYLFFDSWNFILMTNDNIVFKYPWNKIDYHYIDDLTIKSIKADELVNYFILLSDDTIFYIYQAMYSNDFWCQNFEVVIKNKKDERYNEVYDHMNEDWITDFPVCYQES